MVGYNSTVFDEDSEMAGNSSESPPFEFNDYRQRVVVATLYLAVTVLGTLGNTLVLLAVALSRRLRTATNAFVANLAAADLLTCLVLPWTAVATLSRSGLPVGEWVCGMAAVVQATAIGCSMYTLASVGLQRLLLITRPMTTYRAVSTPGRLAAWIALTWAVPLLVTLTPPLLDVGAVGYNKKYRHCGFPSDHPRSNDYDLIVAGGLVTICVCYALIWVHLRRHAKRVAAPEASAESGPTNLTVVSEAGSTLGRSFRRTPVGGGGGGGGTLRGRGRMSQRQAHITRNMAYIVAAFFICLTPFAVCLFYDDSDPFLPYASVILVFNSCVNPLIYATKHRDFKAVFRCILRRRWQDVPEPTNILKTVTRRAF